MVPRPILTVYKGKDVFELVFHLPFNDKGY